MSDQSPPARPKPGSLRDRIAAFENKSSSASSTPGPAPAPAPAPRPKPGGLQWKPRVPSPPSLPSPDPGQTTTTPERKTAGVGGMSASDAMESIGRGGTLKERMAALQGKGAFGGVAPPPPMPPKPVEKPKWKPPPVVSSPPAAEDPQESAARDASRSPPPRGVVSPLPEIPRSVKSEGDDGANQEAEQGDPDPEEEERQRRAALAARMARLGGARVGMGPPIFTPKPVVRKPASPPPAAEAKEEESRTDEPQELQATSPPPKESHSPPLSKDDNGVEPEPAPAQEDFESASQPLSDESITTAPSVPSRAPASMPVPVGPRRAAPPRKKAYKSAPAAPLPEPPTSEAEPETAAPPIITDKEPVSDVEKFTVTPPDEPLVSGDVQKEAYKKEIYEHVDIKQEAEELTDVILTEQPHEAVDAQEEVEVEEEFVEAAEPQDEEATHTVVAVAGDEQPVVQEAPKAEDDEDEDARRKRVAGKLAQMGAFNPFAAPPPIPRRESVEEPTVEEGLDVEDEVNVDVEEVGETTPPPPVLPPRGASVGSVVKHVDEPHAETKAGDEQAPAPVGRDDEPVLTLGTQEGLAHRVPYHLQAGDDDGKDDERTSPSGRNLRNGDERPDDEQNVPEQVAQLAHSGHDQGYFHEKLAGAEQPGELKPTTDAASLSPQLAHGENQEEHAPPIEDDEMAPPRITRPIPPPPVNMASKPSVPPLSPPVSPPPPPVRTSLQVLRADEEDRAASDIPPRPVPPPIRSIVRDVDETGPPTPPRRSVPPIRRTSIQVTAPEAEVPATPPPIPTSPRPRQRPTSPPIITTVTLQPEPEESEDETLAVPDVVPEEEPAQESVAQQQPDVQEDEESARRRTIAERMARLGGIRFAAPGMPALSRPAMPPAPPPTSIPPDDPEHETREEQETEEAEEEDEAARKQRIAAKLAEMGGMRFGMFPPTAAMAPASARRLVSKQEDSENEDAALPVPAPPQRGPPTRKPPPPAPIMDEEKQEGEQNKSASQGTSDDGVQVEAEESEIEEVHYSDAEVPSGEEAPPLPPPRRTSAVSKSSDALPTPPPRMTSRSPPPGRPPVPSIPATLLNRRTSNPAGSEPSSRKSSADYSISCDNHTTLQGGKLPESAIRPQSEYVMVEAESDAETEAVPSPPPPRRSSRVPPHTVPLPPPPPPSAIEPPQELASSAHWELPSIPQGATEFGDSDLASSGWSDDSTAVHVPPPAPVMTSPSAPRRPSSQVPSSGTRRSLDHPQPQLSTDELMAIWGKVGVQVVESATALFEKSKRALVGDGSYAGFVRAVLAQVPGVQTGGSGAGTDEWGYVIYAQTGGAVQRRVAEIMPGDVIAFWDAKLKGHKGLHTYSQTVGAGETGVLVGVVSEFESKKSKVRVWQANQHVGQQTVENVSYRLEDLKSGHVKVFRVLEA